MGASVDTFELRQQWLEKTRLAEVAAQEISNRCEEMARAQSAYYAEKTAQAMALKAAGEPVTYIQTIIKGVASVADAMFDYVIAEGKYKAACEAAKTYRDSMRYAYDEYRRSMEGN